MNAHGVVNQRSSAMALIMTASPIVTRCSTKCSALVDANALITTNPLTLTGNMSTITEPKSIDWEPKSAAARMLRNVCQRNRDNGALVTEGKPAITVERDGRKPFAVSYHGDSTILIDADGNWITGQIPRDRAEAICRALNAASQTPVTNPLT